MEDMYPVAYICLKDKEETTYVKMLDTMVAEAANLNFTIKPNEVSGDYEAATRNAFKKKFNCKWVGCFFHFTKALLKNIKKFNLYTLYLNDNGIQKWFQLFVSA